MQHHLPEIIRQMRKAHGLTQEQLAEAMGVTVGAVSKWELGQSAPDLSTLLELADFFDVSVDALLGYTLRSNSAANTAERLRTLCNEKRFDECLAEAEKALQKYPNDFSVVHRSATCYCLSAITHEDPSAARRALALFSHARTLIAQNTDDEISDVSICNDMAQMHLILKEPETALALLRKHNYDGLNDVRIGMLLSGPGNKPDEAITVLSLALLRNVVDFGTIAVGFLNAGQKLSCTADAVELMRLYCRMLDELRLPGVVSPMDKFESLLLAVAASFDLEQGRPDTARAHLRRSKQLAARFDAAPQYSVTPQSLRFYRGALRVLSDDIGQTAAQGILAQFDEQEPDVRAALLAMWEEAEDNET